MHPDEAAFLEAIRAGDDTARLVFADWLEERGDPRASWVRDPEIWPFMAPDATNPVLRVMDEIREDGDVRTEQILKRLGAGAVPALVAVLDDESRDMRDCATVALGQIGSGASAAVPALVELLGCFDADLRRRAVRVLEKIGSGASAAVPALVALLRDEEGYVRSCNARAWQKSMGSASAVKRVARVQFDLNNDDLAVRKAIERIRGTV